MKKLFAVLSILSCISLNTNATAVSAEVENSCNISTTTSSNQDFLYEVTIPANPTSFPYVISVPAPSEKVICVNGPSCPNVKWDIQGETLNIYLYNKDIFLIDDDNPQIDIITNSSNSYCIKIYIAE